MRRPIRSGLEALALVSALALLLAPVTSEAPKDTVQDRILRHWDLAFTPEAKPGASVSLLFGGDMMFDRAIRLAGEREGDDFLLSCLDPLLTEADLVVANLEGPITATSSVSAGSVVETPENYTFTFPTTTARLLARHNIRLVSIGNNHIMNFGRGGLYETREYLREAGVSWFGDPEWPEEERVARVDVAGIPFSFVNWSDWTSDKTDHTVAQVRKEREAGRVTVVYAHWGEEYEPPTERVKTLARQFVDAGASLVVGSHPHIVQEHEIHKGVPLYYSLGNMIFDQWWEESVATGLLLSVAFTKDGVANIEEIPIQLQRDGRTCPVSESPGAH